MNTAANAAQSTLAPDQIKSLVSGTHSDPFSLLGLHDNAHGKGLVCRVIAPKAESVDLINAGSGRKIASLKMIDSMGLFEAMLGSRKNRFDYRLRVNWGVGAVVTDDPYRFGSCISEQDLYLFCEGKHENAHCFLGANPVQHDAVAGVLFSVWAPAASRVSVVGNFNHWNGVAHGMRKHPDAGVWEIFIPAIQPFEIYKFEIFDAQGHRLPLKADPYAKSMQHPSQTASRAVISTHFEWQDAAWMKARKTAATSQLPVSVYEVHAASWRRKSDQGNRYLSYRELADQLIPYVLELGFTHIQLMPISEYPFDGSWGYQPIGMFAPSIRFGTPDEFREFVNRCHKSNIGVLLDWVPGHFPTDEHGLGKFDGTCLYEHEDVRKGFHPDWNTLIYNYSRNEVVSYLLSNANYWLSEFHLDGLRVDAVASMLYLDYSRKQGEWLPNKHGGRENLEAIELLQTVNTRVYQNHPGIMMIAEESTAWPGVSRPVDAGGLGFGYKWNMGWMNDSLSYMQKDPIYRQHHHDQMTFSTVYAWDENFVLPISHDEVVHGKGSLIDKMPGDDWQKYANLRAFFGFMWAHPGKKLLFMGCEFAQLSEWNHDQGLQWHLLEDARHIGIQQLIRDLNRVYCDIPALHHLDHDASGFEWLQAHNQSVSIFAWLRRSKQGQDVVVISNMTPQTHHDYRVGVAVAGRYREILNTDAPQYGGSGHANDGLIEAAHTPYDGQAYCLSLTIPPLATIMLQIR